MAVVLLLGLILFGPKKTLEMAQATGRILAQIKNSTQIIQSGLQEEVIAKDKKAKA